MTTPLKADAPMDFEGSCERTGDPIDSSDVIDPIVSVVNQVKLRWLINSGFGDRIRNR